LNVYDTIGSDNQNQGVNNHPSASGADDPEETIEKLIVDAPTMPTQVKLPKKKRYFPIVISMSFLIQ
jgi:hypothetical protein